MITPVFQMVSPLLQGGNGEGLPEYSGTEVGCGVAVIAGIFAGICLYKRAVRNRDARQRAFTGVDVGGPLASVATNSNNVSQPLLASGRTK